MKTREEDSINTSLEGSESDISDSSAHFEDDDDINEQKICIFDWDDTLFCTKYLDMHELDYGLLFSEQISIEEVGSYINNELQDLESKILTVFSELIDKNVRIFIITNADILWIANCLKHFMPDLKDFMAENRIKFFSAKNLFYRHAPAEKWKSKCFKKVILEKFSDQNMYLNILCIGDSEEEKFAAHKMKQLDYYEELKVRFLETVKFPSIQTLILQLNFISENFDELLQSDVFLHKIKFEGGKIGGSLNYILEYENDEEGEGKRDILNGPVQEKLIHNLEERGFMRKRERVSDS